jgi:hypothetical protein
MADKVIDPLSAWPETAAFNTADGLPAFRIRPDVLTPGRARMADRCIDLATFAMFVVCACLVIAALDRPDWPMQLVFWFALFAWISRAIRVPIVRLFHKRHEIVMTPSTVEIEHRGRPLKFARDVEHRFILQAHDQAVQEQRQHDAERQQASIDRKVHAPRIYFADSRHVVLELAGHRYDILTVFGPLDAAAILARLQYLDRLLDAAIHRGRGVPNRPEDDWPDDAGGLR